jgi:hypothetical protein
MLKDHFGEEITKICYVGHLIVSMITNITTLETMHCILCHNNLILNLNPKTQARKWLIIYNTINGIVALKKHVNSDHSNVLKKNEEEVNCPLSEEEKQPSKKIQNIF